jgi:uncharacterized membrane protein
MTPTQFGWAYVVALIAMGVLDTLWLGWLARDFYKSELGTLMADSVRLAPAGLFYCCTRSASSISACRPVRPACSRRSCVAPRSVCWPTAPTT